MTVGSLFSGVGGLDVGLEWAGFKPLWFCEIEDYPRKKLKQNWIGVPVYEDVREINAENAVRPDVIAGGFPCQDLSWAGKGAGLDYDLSEQEGTRSGLWWEMWRTIRLFRPRYVIAENVPALTHRGLDIVLGSLASIGYDAEWTPISAAAVGASHIRERIFIVAYPQRAVPDTEGTGRGVSNADHDGQVKRKDDTSRDGREVLADTDGGRAGRRQQQSQACEGTGDVADSTRQRPGEAGSNSKRPAERTTGSSALPDPIKPGLEGHAGHGEEGHEPRWIDERQDRPAGETSLFPGWAGGSVPQPWPVSFKVSLGYTESTDGGHEIPAGEQFRERQFGGASTSEERGAEKDNKDNVADTEDIHAQRFGDGQRKEQHRGGGSASDRVEIERYVRRVADGVSDWIYTDVPDRTARLKALGNAVVPQVAYLVGRAIMERENETERNR